MEEHDSYEDLLAEMEIMVADVDRFPEDIEFHDSESRKMLDKGPEPGTSVDKPTPDTSKEGDTRVSFRSLKRPHPSANLDFQFCGRKSYGQLAAGDFWSLIGRDLRLTLVEKEEFEMVPMPKYTAETLKAILQSALVCDRKRGFHAFGTAALKEDEERLVRSFIATVKSTRMLGLNTEGLNNKHPSRKDEFGCPLPLVTVVIANLSGTVLCFLDAWQMPEELRNILQDVSIVKIGSGLGREGEELDRVGIKLRGWAESGALYRAFLKKEVRTGLKAQCGFLNDFEPSRGLFKYYEYNWKWGSRLRTGNPADIPWGSYSHLSMNVRVPLAVACAVALKFVQDRQLSEEVLVFPIMWEAIDLVRAKSAEDLEDVSPDPQQNWIANVPEGTDLSRHRRLNNCREMTFIRRAQADFVEVLEGFYNPSVKSANAYTMYLDPQGEGLTLPPRQVGVSGRFRDFFERCCSCCGSQAHKIIDCPRVAAGETVVCNYDHDGLTELSPHSTRMCPILHQYCSSCFMRGHHPNAHAQRRFTQRELRARFLMGQPEGLLTSILLLSTRPQGLASSISANWRFGLLAQSFRRDTVSRYHLRIPLGAQLGPDTEEAREQGLQRAAALMQKINLVTQNATMFHPLNALPVPRFIVNDHQERQRNFSICTSTTRESGSSQSVWDRLGPSVPAPKVNTLGGARRVIMADEDEEDYTSEEAVLMPETDFCDAYIVEETIYTSDEEERNLDFQDRP